MMLSLVTPRPTVTRMTKLEILRTICEMPGWQPPTESSSIERYLQELLNEGLVIPRLDGWEATAEALECYPNFYEGFDGKVRGERTGERTQSASPGSVPAERVEVLVRALLEVMPIMSAARLLQASRADLPEEELGWEAARKLTQTMIATDSPTTPSASPAS